MASQLWQRIRAARKFQDLRQQDVAQACGVSRGAVAQWEYEDVERRTQPSIDQMKALAKLSRVPLDWLLSDESDLGSIWGSTSKPAVNHVGQPNSLFETAVQFEVIQHRPDLAAGFNRQLGQDAVSVRPDFLWDRVAIELKSSFSMSSAAQLLLTEQASGRKLNKIMVVFDTQGTVTIESKKSMYQTFGVTVYTVKSAKEAADIILSAC